MPYQTPKTNWQGTDGVTNLDMNRIEGNTKSIKEETLNGLSVGSGANKIARTDSNGKLNYDITGDAQTIQGLTPDDLKPAVLPQGIPYFISTGFTDKHSLNSFLLTRGICVGEKYIVFVDGVFVRIIDIDAFHRDNYKDINISRDSLNSEKGYPNINKYYAFYPGKDANKYYVFNLLAESKNEVTLRGDTGNLYESKCIPHPEDNKFIINREGTSYIDLYVKNSHSSSITVPNCRSIFGGYWDSTNNKIYAVIGTTDNSVSVIKINISGSNNITLEDTQYISNYKYYNTVCQYMKSQNLLIIYNFNYRMLKAINLNTFSTAFSSVSIPIGGITTSNWGSSGGALNTYKDNFFIFHEKPETGLFSDPVGRCFSYYDSNGTLIDLCGIDAFFSNVLSNDKLSKKNIFIGILTYEDKYDNKVAYFAKLSIMSQNAY